MSKTISIISSHGLGLGGEAFVINAETGVVIKATIDIEGFGPVPKSFDVAEFRTHYDHVATIIDVLDIGYTMHDGSYEKPDNEFRANAMREWYFEAMDILSTITAAMENVLLHQGNSMTPGDRQGRTAACRSAREFMQRTNYEEPQDGDADRTSIPIGVVNGRSNGGPCAKCQQYIPAGADILRNTLNNASYCSRECLDTK